MPSDLQQIFSEAVRCHQAGRLGDAEKMYRDLLAVEPRHADVLHLLGMVEMQGGRHREGVAHIEQAIALTAARPVAEFHSNIATGFRALGLLDRAADHLKIAATLKPADAIAHFRAGLLLMEKAAYGEAMPYFRNAVALKTDFAEAHSNLGAALKHLGKLQEALEALRTAASLQPRDAAARYSLGVVLKDMGRLKEAIACFEAATALDPQHAGAQWNMALGHLLSGNFQEGWKTFDWYKKIKGAKVRSYSQPPWDGGDLAGKTILLYEDHGYGDTLQFARYAREIGARAGRVLVSCRPELARLLSRVPGVDAVVGAADPLPPFDCHASFFELPMVMGTSVQNIPSDVPYFVPPADLVGAWHGRNLLKPGLNAGIVWRGNKKTDPRRAMTVQQVAKICAVPGFNWLSLQVGVEPDEQEVLSRVGIADCGDVLSDWADTAALIATLDLVVTVDTGVAHLAGALAKPVWIMLPFVPDWRWLLERTDSPWYPTARLFRQPAIAGWDAVVHDVAQALGGFSRG